MRGHEFAYRSFCICNGRVVKNKSEKNPYATGGTFVINTFNDKKCKSPDLEIPVGVSNLFFLTNEMRR